MKKIIKIIILCVFLTGCTKKLTCTTTNISDTLDIFEKTEILHTFNSIKEINTTVTYMIKDDAISNNFKNIFNTIKEKYSDENIIKTETIEDNTYILNISYNPKKLEEETLKKLNISTKLKEYENYLKSQNMICK